MPSWPLESSLRRTSEGEDHLQTIKRMRQRTPLPQFGLSYNIVSERICRK